MPIFIPGLELSRHFFAEAVKPIIDDTFPDLEYAGGLIGPGSEVLGFDTEMSSDHCWGPRLILFMKDEDMPHAHRLDTLLRRSLPKYFRSYPTSRSQPNPSDNGTWHLEPTDSEVNHAIQISTLRTYLLDHIGFDIESEIDAIDWLTFPAQKLRTLSSANVFHDEIGLGPILDRFKYYPRDIWLYLLSAGWNRIGQEEHLMGRAGSVGDEIGSAIIASRLVRDLMRLCFLMEKQFAPYPKWFGTAFSRLECSTHLSPIFSDVLSSRSWQDRENYLVKAYEYVGTMHDDLAITEPLRATVGDFFGRPFKVIHLHASFAAAIAERIEGASIKKIALEHPMGSIDLISDNTDLLSTSTYRKALKSLYE